MEHIYIIVIMLLTHWVADYVFQSHKIGANKWNNNDLLAEHVGIYVITFLGVGIVILNNLYLPIEYLGSLFIFVGITGICHFITDYFTSKWTHRLWENSAELSRKLEKEDNYSYAEVDGMKKERDTGIHNFFVVLGFDQLLHQLQLILTYYFIFI